MFKPVRIAKAVLFALCLALALCLTASALAMVIETNVSTSSSTDTVVETDHIWSYKTLVKDANCSEPPTYQYTCTICGAKKTQQEGTSNGQHQWGEWVVDTAATCSNAGSRHRQCMLNVHHTEYQTVAATGHTLQWRTVVAATCTSSGKSEYYCTVCGAVVDTATILPIDHTWGGWTIIRQPTCSEPGEQTHTCTKCGTTENGPYGSALGHNWGAWQVMTVATCTTNGQRTRVCQRDPSHIENDVIIATGHNWTAWTVTKTATFWEPGERTRTCTICGLIDTQLIPSITYPNATLCAFGPRLKESNLYPNYSDRWYMFTPFDASMNGSQTYELVAADAVIVGDVTLTIRDGYLTIDYNLKGNDAVRVTLEFFTVLNSISDLNQYEPEALMGLKINRNQAINLYEKFGGDTHLVLYFCSRCSVTYSPLFKALQYNSTAHKALLSTMYALMD